MTTEFHDEGAGRGEVSDQVPVQEPGPQPRSLNPDEIDIPGSDDGSDDGEDEG